MDKVLDAVRESFGRVAYSHKTHQKAVDQIKETAKWLQGLNLLLVTLTAGGTVTSFLGNNRCAEVVTALLSLAALAVTLFQLNAGHERAIQDHRGCALTLWHIRERYVCLIADILDGAVSETEARRIRDVLLDELKQVYDTAPDTNARVYRAARNALQNGQELTFTDEEIDQLLPERLRKAKGKT